MSCAAGLLVGAQDAWITFEPGPGPGAGKQVVLLAGDEEYRSEEALPMLARILARRHGFRCSVFFTVDPSTGTIDPNNQTNIFGLDRLKTADMLILFWRFREPPDDQMRHLVDYLNSGKPILGIRTSTHAISYERNKQSPFARYDWRSKQWPGGFGQQVLGDTWISHHGDHGKESTRGILNPQQKDHPVLRGVEDIWGPTDVYGITHLPAEATILVRGQVLSGMKPTDPPVEGAKNDPMMPLIWVRDYKGETGKTSKAIASTIGAATDLESEGLRRLFVNTVYWAVGLEVPAKAEVTPVGDYRPTPFGFKGFKQGVKPADHKP